MGLVGFAGMALARGLQPALASTAQVVYETGFAYTLSVIPLFILMGNFVARAGLAHELFQAAYAFIGHLRGGLAHATIAACAGFGAICGSSIATAATMSKVAYPSMRQLGYSASLSTGVMAAGGTLGIMIPPSTIMVIYGIITETSIGKLFAAGVIPGLLTALLLMGGIAVITSRDPAACAAGRTHLVAGPLARPARHLGRGPAGGGGARRHLRRPVHGHRRRGLRRGGRLPVRAGAAAPDLGHPVPGAGRIGAHDGDAVHAADRGHDLRQLRELHDRCRAT